MLANRRVLVTRAAEQAGELADALRAAGLEPVLLPTLEFREVDFGELDRALGQLGEFDWLVLTSVNAVKALAARLQVQGSSLPDSLRIAVVGRATGGAVEEMLRHRRPELVSPEPVADSLARELVKQAERASAGPGRFLIVRAQEGREVIEQELVKASAEVAAVAAYRTEAPAASAEALRRMAESGEWPAAATFTSPSSVRNLLALLESVGERLPEGVRRVAIGAVTARAMEECGVPAHEIAAEPSPAAMTEAVLRALGDGSGPDPELAGPPCPSE